MNVQPASNKPTVTFAEAMLAAPEVTGTVGQFKIKLSANGVQLGWLGQDKKGWAVLTTDGQQALTLEQYPYDGKTYYRIKGTSNYMAQGTVGANKAYIGFYGWLQASSFTRSGVHLISDINGQKLSIYSTDNAYIYAWDPYTVLDVAFDQA
jgi:hypothetical protein